MENMETIKQELRAASVNILRGHLGPEVMQTLTGLTTIEGFSTITLGELVDCYAVPTPKSKKFNIGAIRKMSPGSAKAAVLGFIKENPGCKRSVIVEGLGLQPQLVTAAIKKLRDAGEIAMFGERKGAVYLVVDELSKAEISVTPPPVPTEN